MTRHQYDKYKPDDGANYMPSQDEIEGAKKMYIQRRRDHLASVSPAPPTSRCKRKFCNNLALDEYCEVCEAIVRAENFLTGRR